MWGQSFRQHFVDQMAGTTLAHNIKAAPKVSYGSGYVLLDRSEKCGGYVLLDRSEYNTLTSQRLIMEAFFQVPWGSFFTRVKMTLKAS